MAGERVERRLAAILAADGAGYSRRMGGDEEATPAASSKELPRLPPNLTIERCRRTVPAKQTADLETYLDGLRMAGPPE